MFPYQFGQGRERFEAIKLSLANKRLELKLKNIQKNAPADRLLNIDKEFQEKIADVDDCLVFITRVNKPGFIDAEDLKRIDTIGRRTFTDTQGNQRPWITSDEKRALKVRRGNLTDAERKIMNAHVESTYKILSQIPFTSRLKRVPEIASSHHEKLDGSGYPKKLRARHITVQSRILALVDIYDALTAQDRPYKPAMPVDKALKILEFEVKDGHLDGDIYQAFIEHKIFELEDPGADTPIDFRVARNTVPS